MMDGLCGWEACGTSQPMPSIFSFKTWLPVVGGAKAGEGHTMFSFKRAYYQLFSISRGSCFHGREAGG
jgi:hypothetical protein